MPDKLLETTVGSRLAAARARKYLVVGASPVYVTTELLEASKEITLIDIRQKKLDKNAARFGDKLDRRLVVEGDEFSIFPDRSFCCVVFYDVLHHFPDKARVIAETRRILRDDGSAFFSEPNISSKWLREYDQFGELKDSMYKARLVKILEEHFSEVRIHTYTELLPEVRRTHALRHHLRRYLQARRGDPLFRILLTVRAGGSDGKQ